MFQWHVLHEYKTISKVCIELNVPSTMDNETCKNDANANCMSPTLVIES